MRHTEKVAPIAAAASAMATLLCCVPAGLAAAAATASLGAVASRYRGWFIGAAILLLAFGIVQVVQARRACSTRSRSSVWILTASGIIVVLVAVFPQVVAGLLAALLS